MKKLLAVAATTCLLGLAIPATAHHMAEGVISDDLWQWIDDRLTAASIWTWT